MDTLFLFIDFSIDLYNIKFANKYFLLLLFLIPLLLVWEWFKYRQQYPDFRLSSLSGFKGLWSWKAVFRPLLTLLKILAFALLILALARPQNMFTEEKIITEGIDIVMVMDVSGSMLAEDFKPNRLGASKKVAREFIEGRPNDRIGLVVFAGESFTQCPITTDQMVLKTMLTGIRDGLIEDGTAIGMGLATAVNRLKDSEAESKVVILLTDGVNNAGFIDPVTAAEAAKQFEVKVYTIGVGTQGKAPYPVKDIFGRTVTQYMEVQIDEDLLRKIAAYTDGLYFRATDNQSLRDIYAEIDELEKTEMDTATFKRYTEQFYIFAFLALACLVLQWLLKNTIFRGIP